MWQNNKRTAGAAEEFMNTVLKAQAEITSYTRTKLLQLIYTSDRDVRALFFPEEISSGLPAECEMKCRELAVRYVSMIISVSAQHRELAERLRNAGYKEIHLWLKAAGTGVGEDIYLAYLEERLHVPEERTERRAYFDGIVCALTTTAYKRVTEAVSAARSPAPAQLVIAALKVLDGRAYNEVLISWAKEEFFWKTFEGRDLLVLLQSYPWLSEYNVDVLSGVLTPYVDRRLRDDPKRVLEWIESPGGPASFGMLVRE